MENIDIESVQEDSITITKPVEYVTISRSEVEDKISFINQDIEKLELALEGRKTDKEYYQGLLDQMDSQK